METEIFEQAEVLDNLLRTHVNDNDYILFDIPADIQKLYSLQAAHLTIVQDLPLTFSAILQVWKLEQFTQANFFLNLRYHMTTTFYMFS